MDIYVDLMLICALIQLLTAMFIHGFSLVLVLQGIYLNKNVG